MKRKKSCSNCLKGTAITINDDILCMINGVVSADYVCSKHRAMPKFESLKNKLNKCIDCENFLIDIQQNGDEKSIGLCQLFSVRKFDGLHKNPCSKFVKRKKREVS